jgi:hypothetical protein
VFHLPPFTKVAKVGKLLTLANFLDSGFSSINKGGNLLNFGFHYATITHLRLKIELLLSRFFDIKSCNDVFGLILLLHVF